MKRSFVFSKMEHQVPREGQPHKLSKLPGLAENCLNGSTEGISVYTRFATITWLYGTRHRLNLTRPGAESLFRDAAGHLSTMLNMLTY